MQRTKHLAAMALMVLAAREVSGAQDAAQVGTGWTYANLDLDVTILPDENKIDVTGEARLRLEQESSFGPTLVINGRGELLRMLDLTSEPPASSIQFGEKIFDEYPNARATHVRFDEPFARGDEITVRFQYESIGQGSQFKATPTMAFASWTEAWHPVPVFDLEQVALSKALASTGISRIHMPAGWSSASEGELIAREDTDEGVTETWRIDAALARSFAAGPFTKGSHHVDGRTINVYLMAAKPTSAEDQAVILARALEAMEARFGPYPYPTYSIIEIPNIMMVTWYAASQQGLIFAKSGGFAYEGGNLPLFAHEMAHGWWGNLVGTQGPGSILCSESLAQYGAVVAIETLEGSEARNQFLHFSRKGYSGLQCANGYFHMWREGHDKPLAQLESGGWDHNLSDAKGHWMYHMLRARVGDDVFFETLRGLIRDYAGRRLTLEGMRAAFLSAAPDKDLDSFFRQWLEQTGAPVLDFDWWAVENGESVQIEIAQLQNGEPYHLDIEVEIEFLGGETRLETVELRDAAQSFQIATEHRPVNVRLDPSDKLLIWRPKYGPRPTDAPDDEGASDTDG